MTEIAGHEYQVLVGSDVENDGMYLEVADGGGAVLADVFYSDQTGEMTFSAYRADLPLPLVEWMIAVSKERLIPVR